MFKIQDGRKHFYQWDLDRKLIVEDAAITEVHFCNRTDDCSLVCETFVEDGLTLVNVPNILLQTDWKIHVYAYDGSYTKHDECYEVISRTKPSDYAYTETEILNWSKINEKITAVIEEVNAAEATRETAEEERAANEASRNKQEEERVAKEKERQEAETSRANEYSKLVEETTEIKEEADNTLQKVQTALTNVDTATDNANAAATLATNAATNANTAAGAVNDAIEEAEAAIKNADGAAMNASREAGNANSAAENANWATDRANAATEEAITATDKANDAAIKANSAASGINDKFANALKGEASGAIVAITDISPVEHTVDIKAASKNLFKTTNYSKGSLLPDTGAIGGDTKTFITTDFIYLPSGNYILSNITGANLRYIAFYNLNKEFINNTWTARAKKFKFKAQEDCFIKIDIEKDGAVKIDNFDTLMHEYQFMLEKGTTVTEYTPYVDVSTATVNTFGKNLFNNDTSLLKEIDYGTVTKVGYEKTILPAGEYVFSTKDLMTYSGSRYLYGCILDENNNTLKTFQLVAGTTILAKVVVSLNEGCALWLYNGRAAATVEATKELFKSVAIQLEKGTTVTDYEPYIEPTSYPIAADGTVEGVTSIYPNMTITTDTTGVVVDAEYNRDLNKAFAELQQAIISLGGNV